MSAITISSAVLRILLLLVVLAPPFSRGADRGTCDDGMYKVETDLGSEENWKCSGKPFPNTALYTPAGVPEACRDPQDDHQPHCMRESLHYEDRPPSYGPYRPLAPKYGVYQYLPPQRWLHTLKTGGVAFLYHPCADPDQIEELKELARSCLEMYVVTPYAHLTKDKPFAVVTWGCVLRLSWVRDGEIKQWLVERNIHHGVTVDDASLLYNRSLLSYETMPLKSLCEGIRDLPDQHHNQQDTSEPSPSPSELPSAKSSDCSPSNETGVPCHTLRILQGHRTSLTVLIILLGVVLLGFILLFLIKVTSAWRRKRPKNQRYKSVSKYFPFSYEKQDTGVIIPAVGMPKAGATERQVLLNDSDEDEL